MTTERKCRRGDTTEHSTFTGAAGEITVDTDKNVPVVHDNSTPGGFPINKEISVEDEGSEILSQPVILNFVGDSVVVTDAGSGEVIITIVSLITSVNGEVGVVVLAPDDLDDTATTNKFTTAGEITKLAGIETSATADQTGAEIKAAYEGEADTNAFDDASVTKLAGIESGADITDTDNVAAAGALMDSEVDVDIKTLALPASVTISAYLQTLLNAANEAGLHGLINLEIGTDVQAYDADTAKLDVAQAFTAPQRADTETDADGSFDMNAGQDFLWTPVANDTLEFTNETQGQRGMIRLVNTTPYTISLGAEVDAPSGTATALSVAGTYMISYWCYDGTNVAISISDALV